MTTSFKDGKGRLCSMRPMTSMPFAAFGQFKGAQPVLLGCYQRKRDAVSRIRDEQPVPFDFLYVGTVHCIEGEWRE